MLKSNDDLVSDTWKSWKFDDESESESMISGLQKVLLHNKQVLLGATCSSLAGDTPEFTLMTDDGSYFCGAMGPR